MRNTLLTLSLLVLVPAAAHAQFGMKGGIAFSDIGVENGSVDFSNKTGFAGGISYGLRLGENIALQPELLWIQKGGESGNADVTLSYLELPVLFRFEIPTGSVVPFVVAGPYADFKIGDECSVQQANECLDEPKSSDFGLALGAGLRLSGETGITLEIRWDRGLTNINSVEEGFDAKTRAVMLLVGLSF
jgi:opacity protein-like surface antigen